MSKNDFVVNSLHREELAYLICDSLTHKQKELKQQYEESKNSIGFFFLDDLLPKELALKIYDAFPSKEQLVAKKNLREFKYIGVQMNHFDPILEEITYAFQDQKVVNKISEICGLDGILADKNLYAGGLSMMEKENYLNPHLDNSHDKNINLFRVFNLLYYVTPDWELDFGGNLEIWPKGLDSKPITIESKFNRLAVMATHKNSWHSVSKVNVDKSRCCVSNYYFSKTPLDGISSFHVTTFRGRPNHVFGDFVLRADSFFRTLIRKAFPKGIKENKHFYDRENESKS